MDLFLPDLVYCDRKRTIELLSVLVNDLVTEYSLKQSLNQTNDNGLEATLESNIGRIAARYRSGDSRCVEKEGIVKLPTAALFSDLFSILNSKNQIQELQGFDDKIISQLSVGEFVKLDGTFRLSPVEALFSSLIDFVEKFKTFFSTQQNYKQIILVSQMLRSNKSTYIIKSYNDVNYSFLTSIENFQDNLLIDQYEIEGEFTLFGRIRRIIPEGQEVDLIKLLPGKMKLDGQQVMKMFTGLKSSLSGTGVTIGELEELTAESFKQNGPVIELVPIAIYQNY